MDTEVLNRYFQGKCSPEEERLVTEWFKTTEGVKYLSRKIDEDISQESTEEIRPENLYIDSEKLLGKILAAKASSEEMPFISVSMIKHDPVGKAIQHNHRLLPAWARYAAVLAGVMVLALAFWQVNKSAQIIEQTAFGETKTVILPDGSTVILNGNTSLRYWANWNSIQAREVWLDGEAFFSVTHQTGNQKFIVNISDNFNVEVLGTTFNVLKRDQKTKVVLNTGKIKLNIRPQEKTQAHLVMNPGELVEFNDVSTRFVKRKVNPEAHSSWKSNKMIFENTSLAEILFLLEHTYGLTVEVRDSSLLDQKLNGTIPTESVDVLLDGLSHLFNLKITKSNQYVTIEND